MSNSMKDDSKPAYKIGERDASEASGPDTKTVSVERKLAFRRRRCRRCHGYGYYHQSVSGKIKRHVCDLCKGTGERA